MSYNFASSAGFQQQQQQQYAQASYSSYAAPQAAYAAPQVAYAAPQVSFAYAAPQPQQQQQQSCGASQAAAQSQIEQAVIHARQPIQVHEHEQISTGQYSGTYLNKSEADQFRGPIPLEQYAINQDPNPEVIRKKLDKLKYRQEIAVRYLNPPAAPKPGDIIVRERQSQVPAAPPVVIRQEGCRSGTPPPQVFREHPPCPPPCIPEQVVEIDACPQPPPPRRVVVEKLGNLPPKPQNILIEKWLPYRQQRRRVVFQRSCAPQQSCAKNLVVEWEAPDVEVEQVCQNLGVQEMCPEEYKRRYGCELRQPCEMPNLCQCQQQSSCGGGNQVPELEGDVEALRCVNLEAYGLGEYRRYVQ